jgi:hypothetical protein
MQFQEVHGPAQARDAHADDDGGRRLDVIGEPSEAFGEVLAR